MVGAGGEPELRGERFRLLGLEPGGLEVAGGGERVGGGASMPSTPLTSASMGAATASCTTWASAPG